MEKRDVLFDYMKKMKNVIEFLARGNDILTQDKKVISFDRQMITENGCVSIEEAELFDPIECKYYNELGSIHRISKLINEELYEELEQEMLPYISQPFGPESVDELSYKEYKMLKSRLKELLNKLVIQLYMGLRAKPTSMEIAFIEALDEDLQRKEQIIEDEEEPELDEYFEDLEKNIPQKELEKEKYLTYSMGQKKFYLIQDNEVLIDGVNPNLAMEVVTGYLYREEKERATAELLTGRTQKPDIEYDGIHIYIDKDSEQR